MIAARHVALLGLPGTGKTTVLRELALLGEWGVLSVGEALREMAVHDSGLATDLAAGRLAPEGVVLDIVRDAVLRRGSRSLVMDGFPRHPKQVADAKLILGSWRAVLLVLTREEAARRIEGRRACARCGLVTSDANSGRCLQCNGPLHQRPEDQPGVLEGRLTDSAARLDDLLVALPSGVLSRVDANRDPGLVLADVVGILRALR